MPQAATATVPDVRISPDNQTILKQLGLLQDLAGTWKGRGFNLIARPDFHHTKPPFNGVTDLYLQLNQTRDNLKFEPIGSAIPNRGFGQDDIQLFGLTYLQQITDEGHDGALHIEPGIWVTQPATTFPVESVPAPAQLVARMATIPHGNSVLAQGIATPFTGTPVLTTPGNPYKFSLFPSFNTTPFGVPPTAPGVVFNAAGSSEKLTAAALGVTPFPQYDLTVPVGPIPLGPLNPPFTLNTRTPFDTTPAEPPLPASINGVAMQDVVNDPIRLLEKEIQDQVAAGYTFEGTALNIATTSQVTFQKKVNAGVTGPPDVDSINVPQFGGGVENIQFLVGESPLAGSPPAPQPQENAQTAMVYATFWIEKLTNKQNGHTFMQLQYAQMVVLNFPLLHLFTQPPGAPEAAKNFVDVGWPHITVGTLKKSFS